MTVETRSTGMPVSDWPACRPMYASARSSPSLCGAGTTSLIGIDCPGFVPQDFAAAVEQWRSYVTDEGATFDY